MNVSPEIKAWRRVELNEFNRAQSVSPYHDDAQVLELTQEFIAKGKRIFHLFRLHKSDKEHVSALLQLFDLPEGARVLDIGCGVGEVAKIMRDLRPDLHFTLLNISRSQLDMCPLGMEKLQADMHTVPALEGSYDAVMLCYSLGHSILWQLAQEVSRLLKPGGRALFSDVFAGEYAPNLAPTLGYVGYLPQRLVQEMAANGLDLEAELLPESFTMPSWIARHLPGGALKGAFPTAMRFRKKSS
ncbi:class I SAM-dependent methyltransferase [Agrobacterium tumefaciens]|uniref:class I SAM-dependent methyltransferase n=1 Tax=Agrobacterium tumefaciens TaxID=358 RepID=UPI0015742523|nr:class I SAM-dependent methyltransferase [Agrobacterium tumefaciens]